MDAFKSDNEIKSLIIEALDNNPTGGGDLDGLFFIDGNFIIIEFLRCITVRPHNSHPNRYWNYGEGKVGNKNKFLALWKIAQKTNSRLILVNYEDSREQFKLIEVLGLNESQKIYKEKATSMNYEEFKAWFLGLNSRSSI